MERDSTLSLSTPACAAQIGRIGQFPRLVLGPSNTNMPLDELHNNPNLCAPECFMLNALHFCALVSCWPSTRVQANKRHFGTDAISVRAPAFKNHFEPAVLRLLRVSGVDETYMKQY